MNNNPFHITLPDDWEDQTVHTFVGPVNNGIRQNIVVTVDPYISRKSSEEEYAKQRLINLQSSLPSFELLKYSDNTLPSGRSCHEMVYRYCTSGKSELYQKQICIFESKKAYLFTSTFTVGSIDLDGPLVDRIIDTLKSDADWSGPD